jgi:hypothetical protein
LGEFQILCEQNLIDYQTTSRDHMKMNRLGKKVVQMVKWGSQKKGRLKYWNLQLPWLAMGYQFKQTSLPSFSLFFVFVAAMWIYLQQFDKTSLQYLTLIMWVPTCEQQTNLFKQTMPMALENLAIAQHVIT